MLQEQIDAGLITPEQAAFSSNKNLVTRAVGVEDTVLLETHLHDVMPGDIYLLCSDGLSDMLDDESIAQLLQGSDALAPPSAAVRAFGGALMDGSLLAATGFTLGSAALGLLIEIGRAHV